MSVPAGQALTFDGTVWVPRELPHRADDETVWSTPLAIAFSLTRIEGLPAYCGNWTPPPDNPPGWEDSFDPSALITSDDNRMMEGTQAPVNSRASDISSPVDPRLSGAMLVDPGNTQFLVLQRFPAPGDYRLWIAVTANAANTPSSGSITIYDSALSTPLGSIALPSTLSPGQFVDAKGNVTTAANWVAASDYGGEPLDIETLDDSVNGGPSFWLALPIGVEISIAYVAVQYLRPPAENLPVSDSLTNSTTIPLPSPPWTLLSAAPISIGTVGAWNSSLTANVTASARYDGEGAFPDDQYGRLTIAQLGSGGLIRITLRDNAVNGWVQLNNNFGVNEGASALGSGTLPSALAVGDTFSFEAEGTSLVFKRNNVTLWSGSASTVASGNPGFMLQRGPSGATPTYVRDFEAGEWPPNGGGGGPQPVTLASDALTSPVGAWGSRAGWQIIGDAWSITANGATGSSTTPRPLARYTGVSFPNDQWVQATIGSVNTNGGLALRVGPSPTAWYWCQVRPDGCWIHLMSGSSFATAANTTLNNDSTFSAQTGDVIYFEAVGSVLTLRVTRAGSVVQTLTATDSTVASGAPGIQNNITTIDLQPLRDWSAGGFQ